jgi:RNA polymerase sigma factor (sigma-70 family)
MDVKSASGHSFEKLCLSREIRAQLIDHANRYCQSRDRARDIVQDALVRAFLAWPTWTPRPDMDPLKACESWLLRITSRVCYNQSAKERLHRDREGEHVVEILDQTHGALIELVSRRGPPVVGQRDARSCAWISEDVKAGIAELRQPYREYLERFYLLDQSCEEIAAAMKRSVAVVTSMLHRGRQELRPHVASYAEAVYGFIDTAREEAPTEPTEVVEPEAGRVKRVV